MANIKILLYTSKKLNDDKHPVVLKLTHERKRKYYTIGDNNKGYACTINEWDSLKDRFKQNFPDYKIKNQILSNKESEAKTIILKAELDKIDFSFKFFKNEFIRTISKNSIFSFIDEEVKRLKNAGNYGYAALYKYTKTKISNFAKNPELKFSDVDYNFLKHFENDFYSRGVKPNSIGACMRVFRTIFNSAIKSKLCREENYPFNCRNNPNGYSLKDLHQETQKRAITKEQMIKIKEYKAKEGSLLFHSKNYFLFSFYCMGINFYDIAHLKWVNIINDRLEYTRAKTGCPFTIKLLPEVIEMLRYYKKNKKTEYIFPILNPKFSEPNQQYNRTKSMLRKMNLNLQTIAKAVGINFTITSYVARHTWATIVKNNGVSISVISEGLGHKTETITHTYLKKFENTVLDDANKNLLI